MKSRLLALTIALALGGCTGLAQFPKTLEQPSTELAKRDAEYAKAITEIGIATTPEAKQLRRNQEIERRLRVVDLNFNDFQTALAKENVQINFGSAVVEIGIGVAGSLAAETASQILSAVSAGVVGTQQAYGKTALFEQTLSALLAQMVASRKAILVRIYDGMNRTIDEYPLAAAVQDLEAYYFAGSLPGAIIATAADAKVKNDEAEDNLANLRENTFAEDESGDRLNSFLRPPDGKPENQLNQANRDSLREWIDNSRVRGLPFANFISNPELRDLRGRAIRDLKIP